MPAAQIKLDDGYESFSGIIDIRNMQEHLGVAHEAKKQSAIPLCVDVGDCRRTWLFSRACFEAQE